MRLGRDTAHAVADLIEACAQREPKLCGDCGGTGEDCGLTCCRCDGSGLAAGWRFWSNSGTTTLTREQLDRAFFALEHPLNTDA